MELLHLILVVTIATLQGMGVLASGILYLKTGDNVKLASAAISGATLVALLTH